MKVALNGWFWDQPHTGSGQYLRALAEHLPRAAPEDEYTLVLPSFVRQSLISNLRLPASRSHLGKVLFEQFAFPRACRQLRADVSHVPYWAPPLRSPTPVVVTVHDLIPLLLQEYRGSALARLYTALVAAATSGAALVIADSDNSRADVLRHLGLAPERVRAIPLAIGPEYCPSSTFGVDPALQAKYNLPDEGGGYVLYLGGFDPRKNVRALLAGWTWASDAIGAGYALVIAGRLPPGSDLIAYAADLKIAGTVRFIGPVDEADKPALYRGASCFVYPSRYEGFGLPVLEAMACGTPVVTTSAGSLAEVAGDAAYLVNPDDSRSIGAGIIAVLVQEHLADELRAKGLAQAAKFSWEKTARETAEAYRAAMRETGK